MTGSNRYAKSDIRRCWLYIPQLFFCTSAIILLSALNLSGYSIEIKRPGILLVASIFVLFNFEKSNRLSIVAKIILLYIIEMFFNQLSGRFFHIRSFSIHLSLFAIAPLMASFIYSIFSKPNFEIFTADKLAKSWMVVFAILVLHMVFLFILLKNIYGYGYDRTFAVFANMCLYFLVFIFIWKPLEQIKFRRITAIIFATFFVVIMIKGY